MVSSVCGGNQVRSTKTGVSCLQSSMVVGVSWSGAAWVLLALGSHSSLREPWMPTCTVTYWSGAWSPPFGDWAAGQCSNMIILTTALLKKLRVKVMDWHIMSPDLNPIEHLWGILKLKVEEHKVSNGAFPLHGTARYGSLLGGFPLGTVPGTWYFFSTTLAGVPSDPYRYQNVTCKLYWSLIGRRKSSLLRHWTCDTKPNIYPLDLNQHSQRRIGCNFCLNKRTFLYQPKNSCFVVCWGSTDIYVFTMMSPQ